MSFMHTIVHTRAANQQLQFVVLQVPYLAVGFPGVDSAAKYAFVLNFSYGCPEPVLVK
jgi:hypothetical protein